MARQPGRKKRTPQRPAVAADTSTPNVSADDQFAAEAVEDEAGAEGEEEVALEAEAELARPIRAAIVELNGREDGRVTVLRLAPGERAVIGRTGDGLTVQLGYDRWVSATHAQVWIDEGDEGDEWWLEDLSSRNGTELQHLREPVVPHVPVRLRMGDIFRVGHTDLLLTDTPDRYGSTLQLA